jgi:type I restriction enzyme S subunit
VLENEYSRYFLNQRVAKIELDKNYDYTFIKFFLKHKRVKSVLIGVSRGVRQANISNEDFYKLEVIKPSITLQNQFAEKILLIEQQKELAKQELKESEDLFNCLLQKAFKGELVR